MMKKEGISTETYVNLWALAGLPNLNHHSGGCGAVDPHGGFEKPNSKPNLASNIVIWQILVLLIFILQNHKLEYSRRLICFAWKLLSMKASKPWKFELKKFWTVEPCLGDWNVSNIKKLESQTSKQKLFEKKKSWKL